MAAGRFHFDRFQLDPDDRLLTCDGAPVELNARYLDALTLLVREAGKLVSKDRFLEEVWRGVPVTDEALTQCIRTLRRQLGDDAARPRFIETVPKHGYRFIAPLEAADEAISPSLAPVITPVPAWRQALLVVAAGAGGGAAAGGFGGLFYGFAGASQSQGPGMGSSSVLAVMVSVCLLTGLAGGLGVGAGIAAFNLPKARPWYWSLIGGAVGGMVIGAVVKLLGLDAFNLLFGRAPDQIAGGLEGMILGGATGLAAGLIRYVSPGRALAAAALLGGLAGLAITAMNGRLMAGSLDALARQFPDSRLSLQPLGKLFGEAAFGPISRIGTPGLEGALFAACIVGAILYVRRRLP
ncbi:MAG: transcriptional regulator [Caulobacter sp.]|nr:transcriptional regulator [Caulobacter sp.]